MDPDQLLSLGAFPFVVGIVQLYKRSQPLAPDSIVIGVAFVSSLLMTEAITYVQHTDYVVGAILGVATWLSAMGSWSGSKALLKERAG